MKIAVLGSRANWHLNDLRRAADRMHEIQPASYQELHSHVAEQAIHVASREHVLAEFDAVLVRTMPPGSLEQVVFRMDALAQLEAAGVCVLNAPRAIEVAVDKYLALARLQQAGLLVPETIACQTADQALEAFGKLGGDVVAKPLFGGEGRGITRTSDTAIALRAFKALEQVGSVIYLQRYMQHEGCDLRLLVVGEKILGMRRRNPHDWRTNISRGAVAEPLEVTSELAELALRAAKAVGAEIAGVDLLPAADGRLYALEVNAVPGWRALADATGVDVGKLILDFLTGAASPDS